MIEAEYKAQLPQNSNEKPVDNKSNNLEKNDSTQKDSRGIKEKMNIENDEIVTQLNGDNETEEPPKKKKKKSKQSLNTDNNKTETKLKENVEPQTTKKPKKNKNNDSIQELQEIKENEIIDSGTIEKLNNNCKSEETPKKKKKSKKSLNAVNNETEIKKKEDADLQPAKKTSLPEINYDTKDILNVKDKNSPKAQPSLLKKFEKNKIKSDIEVNNDKSHNVVSKTENICIENGENGILHKKSELTISKKEKKEMKKKIKYQQELETVSYGIMESDKEPILKKKKRKLINNEENEEPRQKIIKTGNFDVFIIAYIRGRHTCMCCLHLI